MDSVEKVKYLIANNIYMTIATADKQGKPWVSPVGFMYDDHHNLYWVSNKHAQHSNNIRIRPEVAIVIFGPLPGGDIDGVYIDAKAVELDDPNEIKSAIVILAERPQPPRFITKSVEDVTGDAVWRIYRASPVAIYKRGDAALNDQAITVREPIIL